MAVNSITGVNGGVTWADLTADISKYTSNFTRDIHVVTPFSAAANKLGKIKVGGQMRAAGTLTAFFTGTTPTLTQIQTANYTGATLQLDSDIDYASTPQGWTFKALISNIAIVVDKIGLVVITANFRSNGTITSNVGAT